MFKDPLQDRLAPGGPSPIIDWENVPGADGQAVQSWFPTSGWGVLLVLVGLALTLIGGWWVYRRRPLELGFLALGAGLIIMAFVLAGPTGIHLHLWHPHMVWMLVPLIGWVLAKATWFTHLDDMMVMALGAVVFVLTLAVRGLLGSMSPATPVWWLLVAIWLIALLPAMEAGWDTRRDLRWVCTTVGWVLLAVTA